MTRAEMFGETPVASHFTTVNNRLSCVRLEFTSAPRIPNRLECGPHDAACRRYRSDGGAFGFATHELDLCPKHSLAYQKAR